MTNRVGKALGKIPNVKERQKKCATCGESGENALCAFVDDYYLDYTVLGDRIDGVCAGSYCKTWCSRSNIGDECSGNYGKQDCGNLYRAAQKKKPP